MEFMRLRNSLSTCLWLFTDWWHLAGSSWIVTSRVSKNEIIALAWISLLLIILIGQGHNSGRFAILFIIILLLILSLETWGVRTCPNWCQRQIWGWLTAFMESHWYIARFFGVFLVLLHWYYFGCLLRSS